MHQANRKLSALLFVLAVAAVVTTLSLLTSFAQSSDAAKPYAGQEKREVTTLSAEEIQAYLSGQGMGLAKAAELNSYPGPRHVLELAAQLQLSERQRVETQQSFDAMHREAVRLGQLIVEKERALDAMFAQKQIDAGKLQSATREIGLLQGRLRAAHLSAHLEMRRILSPAQVRKYDELRGYNAPEADGAHKHHRGQGKQ
jgi:hypothetical protein